MMIKFRDRIDGAENVISFAGIQLRFRYIVYLLLVSS